MHILSVHNGSYTVELLWDGEETGNATYVITISSNGETWINTVAREDGKTSINLSYNTNYRLDVVATNCAGDSEGFITFSILIGNNVNHDNKLLDMWQSHVEICFLRVTATYHFLTTTFDFAML